MKTYILIPAYNEAKVIGEVIGEVRSSGFSDIIVVDDGSADATCEMARKKDVIALRHMINRGKGAAVKTGFEALKKLDADRVVTMDGDGQHDTEDIKKLLTVLDEGFDVALGSRLLDPKGMPLYKRLHNKIGNFCVWFLYGLYVTDSQSGFRAYGRKALEKIQTHTDRYEYDSEVIREIYRHKLSYKEIPITVRYTDYSMGKQHKMNLKNGIKTLLKMILH